MNTYCKDKNLGLHNFSYIIIHSKCFSWHVWVLLCFENSFHSDITYYIHCMIHPSVGLFFLLQQKHWLILILFFFLSFLQNVSSFQDNFILSLASFSCCEMQVYCRWFIEDNGSVCFSSWDFYSCFWNVVNIWKSHEPSLTYFLNYKCDFECQGEIKCFFTLSI